MNQPLPLRNRIIEISLGITQEFFPVATGINIPGLQIPVGHGITRKEILPTVQANIGAIRRIGQADEFFNTISQRHLPCTTSCIQQPPQLRLTVTAEYILQLPSE